MAGKALAASLAVHALAALVLAVSASRSDVPVTEPVAPAPAPLVVTLIDEPPARALPAPAAATSPPPTPPRPGRKSAAGASGRAAGQGRIAAEQAASPPGQPGPETPEPVPTTTPGATTTPTPRRIGIPSPEVAAATLGGEPEVRFGGGFGGLATLGLGNGVNARLAAVGAEGEARTALLGEGRSPLIDRLDRHPDGSFTSDKTAFVATIHPDGRVRFKDKPNFHVDVAFPSVAHIKAKLREWYNDPLHRPTLGADGILPMLTGGFDLTDWYLRSHGEDPYRYEKTAFARRTEAQRADMAEAWRAERVQTGLRDLPGRLRRMWAGPGPVEARRQRLFQAWDECAESDDEVGRAGAAARATILAFIRHTPDAAPPADELARDNAVRRSHARFAP